MTYEELLMGSEKQNLIVKEKDLPGYKGRIYKNRIAIRKDILNAIKSENRPCCQQERFWSHPKMNNNSLARTYCIIFGDGLQETGCYFYTLF